mmetsp:Transcript_22658/g.34235  ORF Transcript_22658/g.34235 Transcript_22658/m.34235 type:complete len:277 (+) Transcript_22658:73-903(+)
MTDCVGHQDTDLLFHKWDSDENGVLNVCDIMNGMNGLSSKIIAFDEDAILEAFNSVVETKKNGVIDSDGFSHFLHQLVNELGIDAEDLFHSINAGRESITPIDIPVDDAFSVYVPQTYNSLVGDASNFSDPKTYNVFRNYHSEHIRVNEDFQRKSSMIFSLLDADGDGLIRKGEVITKLKENCKQQELLFDEAMIPVLRQSPTLSHPLNFDEFCCFLSFVAKEMGIESEDILALLNIADLNVSKHKTTFVRANWWCAFFRRIFRINRNTFGLLLHC